MCVFICNKHIGENHSWWWLLGTNRVRCGRHSSIPYSWVNFMTFLLDMVKYGWTTLNGCVCVAGGLVLQLRACITLPEYMSFIPKTHIWQLKTARNSSSREPNVSALWSHLRTNIHMNENKKINLKKWMEQSRNTSWILKCTVFWIQQWTLILYFSFLHRMWIVWHISAHYPSFSHLVAVSNTGPTVTILQSLSSSKPCFYNSSHIAQKYWCMYKREAIKYFL